MNSIDVSDTVNGNDGVVSSEDDVREPRKRLSLRREVVRALRVQSSLRTGPSCGAYSNCGCTGTD
jgi:hypothetical protein